MAVEKQAAGAVTAERVPHCCVLQRAARAAAARTERNMALDSLCVVKSAQYEMKDGEQRARIVVVSLLLCGGTCSSSEDSHSLHTLAGCALQTCDGCSFPMKSRRKGAAPS